VLARLPAIVDDACHRLHLPTVAVGIAQGQGQEQQFVVRGRLGLGRQRADINTVYRIASASKAFIATSLMLLCDTGRLSLDEPIRSYLPDFRMFNDELSSQLTVRDALCHRSGLPRHDIQTFTTQDDSLEQLVHKLRWLEPAYGLRERFHYQNHMYGVLSLLLQRLNVQGVGWGEFVDKHIFALLRMTRSHTRSDAAGTFDDNWARSRTLLTKPLRLNIPFIAMRTDNAGGAGSLCCSVRDLLAWGSLNLQRGRWQGRQLMPTHIFDELHSPQMPIGPGEMRAYTLPHTSDEYYGLGWFIERHRGERLVYHGGSYFGYRSIVGFLPACDLSFVVLTNQDSSCAPEALAYTLCDHVMGAEPFDWTAVLQKALAQTRAQRRQRNSKVLAAPAASRRAADVRGLEGSYAHPAYGTITVRRCGARLSLAIAGLTLALKPNA
jgi:CubicO group peptidase (beta-lactamase class C family)